MKHFGDIDLGFNYISNVVLSDSLAFQTNPKKGSLAFIGNKAYICAEIDNGVPLWTPLINEVTSQVVVVETASTTWVIDHGLNTSALSVEVYNTNQELVIPNSVVLNTANRLTITFGAAMAGQVVCTTGSTEGTKKANATYERTLSVATTEVAVQHNLGYNPTVAVYDVNNVLILPDTITHNSLFSTTVTFSEPTVGTIRFA